jgi:hypothetical protein
MGYIPLQPKPGGMDSSTGYALTLKPYTTTSTSIRRPSMATNNHDLNDPLTRRQFFARLRTLGFSKSGIQLARNALTYRKDLDGGGYVLVTVPKGHESTFHISGRVPYSGIYVEHRERNPTWGTPVVPEDLFCNNMLEVCLGLLSGDILVGTEAPY